MVKVSFNMPAIEPMQTASELFEKRLRRQVQGEGGEVKDEDLGLGNRTLAMKKPSTETIKLACICCTFDKPSILFPYTCWLLWLDVDT